MAEYGYSYCVIVAASKSDLTELVNDAMVKGWQPSGGVCVAASDDNLVYAQRMDWGYTNTCASVLPDGA